MVDYTDFERLKYLEQKASQYQRKGDIALYDLSRDEIQFVKSLSGGTIGSYYEPTESQVQAYQKSLSERKTQQPTSTEKQLGMSLQPGLRDRPAKEVISKQSLASPQELESYRSRALEVEPKKQVSQFVSYPQSLPMTSEVMSPSFLGFNEPSFFQEITGKNGFSSIKRTSTPATFLSGTIVPQKEFMSIPEERTPFEVFEGGTVGGSQRGTIFSFTPQEFQTLKGTPASNFGIVPQSTDLFGAAEEGIMIAELSQGIPKPFYGYNYATETEQQKSGTTSKAIQERLGALEERRADIKYIQGLSREDLMQFKGQEGFELKETEAGTQISLGEKFFSNRPSFKRVTDLFSEESISKSFPAFGGKSKGVEVFDPIQKGRSPFKLTAQGLGKSVGVLKLGNLAVSMAADFPAYIAREYTDRGILGKPEGYKSLKEMNIGFSSGRLPVVGEKFIQLQSAPLGKQEIIGGGTLALLAAPIVVKNIGSGISAFKKNVAIEGLPTSLKRSAFELYPVKVGKSGSRLIPELELKGDILLGEGKPSRMLIATEERIGKKFVLQKSTGDIRQIKTGDFLGKIEQTTLQPIKKGKPGISATVIRRPYLDIISGEKGMTFEPSVTFLKPTKQAGAYIKGTEQFIGKGFTSEAITFAPGKKGLRMSLGKTAGTRLDYGNKAFTFRGGVAQDIVSPKATVKMDLSEFRIKTLSEKALAKMDLDKMGLEKFIKTLNKRSIDRSLVQTRITSPKDSPLLKTRTKDIVQGIGKVTKGSASRTPSPKATYEEFGNIFKPEKVKIKFDSKIISEINQLALRNMARSQGASSSPLLQLKPITKAQRVAVKGASESSVSGLIGGVESLQPVSQPSITRGTSLYAGLGLYEKTDFSGFRMPKPSISGRVVSDSGTSPKPFDETFSPVSFDSLSVTRTTEREKFRTPAREKIRFEEQPKFRFEQPLIQPTRQSFRQRTTTRLKIPYQEIPIQPTFNIGFTTGKPFAFPPFIPLPSLGSYQSPARRRKGKRTYRRTPSFAAAQLGIYGKPGRFEFTGIGERPLSRSIKLPKLNI